MLFRLDSLRPCLFLFSFGLCADKFSHNELSVRPSSHITAMSSIDSLRHHPSTIELSRNLRILRFSFQSGGLD